MEFFIFVALCAIAGILMRICQALIDLNKTMSSFTSGSANLPNSRAEGEDEDI